MAAGRPNMDNGLPQPEDLERLSAAPDDAVTDGGVTDDEAADDDSADDGATNDATTNDAITNDAITNDAATNDAATTDTRPEVNTGLPRPQDFVRLPGVTDDALKEDLLGIGFGEEKTNQMIKQPQPFSDPWKDVLFSKEGVFQEARLKREGAERARKKRKRDDAYEPLFLKEGSDWALYDPGYYSYPSSPGWKAPRMFRDFESYKPGNKRVVEINVQSSNVRIRSTPTMLLDRRIDYQINGPRLVGDEVEERATKRTVGNLKQPAKRKPGRPPKPTTTALGRVSKPAKKTTGASNFTLVEKDVGKRSSRSATAAAAASTTTEVRQTRSSRSVEASVTATTEAPELTNGRSATAAATTTTEAPQTRSSRSATDAAATTAEAPQVRKTVVKEESEKEDSESDLTDIE
ncbi:uncharacterized protein LTR77_006741 [Saxophila tyrrhenica]|uniref:Uncharacterized protein n=1 Tax=Saxophila tyrrhenica TaxID=1690608 RepID=A0AAV9P9G5_9PEZI|nr:hypothetical protein LTR77_006741 [Saxophila tyrrhenica]